MTESQDGRAERLQAAQDKSLETRQLSTGLIPPVTAEMPSDAEPIKFENPIEGAMYDALIYLREGMTYEETLKFILIRNRISQKDAEAVMAQVPESRKKA